MKKIRFGVVGGGWRARFFITAAQHLPELFELTGVYMRNPEKAAALSAELNIPTFTSIEELAATNPEFVIVSVSRTASFEILCKVMELGLPILCETPPVWFLRILRISGRKLRNITPNSRLLSSILPVPCWLHS